MMPVYVDPLFECNTNPNWRWSEASHLFADTVGELHSFADRLDLKREWFQCRSTLPHYDLTRGKRYQAVRLGAIELSGQSLLDKWREIRTRVIPMTAKLRKLRDLYITEICVLTGRGTDHISLKTNKPSTTPALSKEPMSMTIHVTCGHGVEYVREVFGLEPDVVIDMNKGVITGKEFEPVPFDLLTIDCRELLKEIGNIKRIAMGKLRGKELDGYTKAMEQVRAAIRVMHTRHRDNVQQD